MQLTLSKRDGAVMREVLFGLGKIFVPEEGWIDGPVGAAELVVDRPDLLERLDKEEGWEGSRALFQPGGKMHELFMNEVAAARRPDSRGHRFSPVVVRTGSARVVIKTIRYCLMAVIAVCLRRASVPPSCLH